jgi:hypothetical protein
VDVRAQRLQRRDVDDADLIGQRAGEALLHEIVQRREKRGERLPRAGRRGDQRVAAAADGRPALRLRRRRLAERFVEPLRNEGME